MRYHNLGAKEKSMGSRFPYFYTVSAPKSSPAATIADPVPRPMLRRLGELEGEVGTS